MSMSIDNAFIKQYESEVKAAYQRSGSLIRGTVRTRNGVRAEDLTFPKVGKGSASTKARHGDVPVMNLDWNTVTAPIADYFAGEYIDSLDQLKTNVDIRTETVRAAASALGRKTDDILIAAAVAASENKSIVTGSGTSGFLNSVIEAVELMGSKDVPPDAAWYAQVSWRFWSWMMRVDEFASSDYTGPDLRPFTVGGRALMGKTWMGVHWMTHSGLPKDSNDRTCLLYHSDAIGHAIQHDISTTMSWENVKDAFFVNTKMAMGAVLIDDDGVVKMEIDESVALPTS